MPPETHVQGSDPNGSPERPSFFFRRSYNPTPELLPFPVTTSSKFTSKVSSFLEIDVGARKDKRKSKDKLRDKEQVILSVSDEKYLFPGYMPPKYHLFDVFPFSLLVGVLTARGKEVKGKTAAKIRSHMKQNSVSHNLPHEISLYLVSSARSYWCYKIFNQDLGFVYCSFAEARSS
jgi:ion channel-forming bestrophin family protein